VVCISLVIEKENIMLYRVVQSCYVFLLVCCLFVPVIRTSAMSNRVPHALADFPTVDPNYTYDQLFHVATNFQHREAGYDANLPVNINGHDEFAAYWMQEMMRNLQGFGAQASRDEFGISGWRGRAAKVLAFNVEVSVPGAIHPEQVVVIGCHYDGEAISTQSANDDASGCAIELAVAKAMGNYWRSHHTYPARTLRFVIFDAEEQGLYGSFHYLNDTVNGDVANIVAMFNEEQNGIAYPLRYLGQLTNPLLPLYVALSPLQNSELYPERNLLSSAQRENIMHFRALMQQAVPGVFQQFQALGFRGLTYHAGNGQDVAQPIFTADQLSNIHLEDDTVGGSDQIPFTLAGVPSATFVGNSTYYDRNPPAWSYPFDQSQDTIQLMNTFADGSSQKSNALMLALALPGMLTTWMLNQSDVLGQASADADPIAAISDIGNVQIGRSITLDAKASFDPHNPGASLTYTWDFGDGTQASGITVDHTYAIKGNYTLTLTVRSATGMRQVQKIIPVLTQPVVYNNPYKGDEGDGNPPSNPQVILPRPDDTLSDKVLSSPNLMGSTSRASVPPVTSGQSAGMRTLFGPIIISIGVLIVALIGIWLVVMQRQRNAKL
jgi:PKD repeat protein